MLRNGFSIFETIWLIRLRQLKGKNLTLKIGVTLALVVAQWEVSKVESYGFEYMGTAPAVKNTITIYNSCVPHKAYIGDEVDRSWSQLVQLSKRRHFTSSYDVVGSTDLNNSVFNLNL